MTQKGHQVTDLDSVSTPDYCKLMTGFTKLFSGIVYSTIWQEPLHVRVVWVTMLALADREGNVAASLPGLAKASGVTMEQCAEALEVLKSPDQYSRSKEFEGRRTVEIDGGWKLLNYLKYREMRSADERRIQVRQAVQRHRMKSNVSRGKPQKAQAEAEAEADTELPIATARAGKSWLSPYLAIWHDVFGGKLAIGRAAKAFGPLRKEHPEEEVLARWRHYCERHSEKPGIGTPQGFAATYGSWNPDTDTMNEPAFPGYPYDPRQ